MRKWSRALLPAMFGMLAAVVVQAADYRTQYAEQWPLTLSSAQSGAYRIVLEPAIYRRAVSRRPQRPAGVQRRQPAAAVGTAGAGPAAGAAAGAA
jgi:hypothetical protein